MTRPAVGGEPGPPGTAAGAAPGAGPDPPPIPHAEAAARDADRERWIAAGSWVATLAAWILLARRPGLLEPTAAHQALSLAGLLLGTLLAASYRPRSFAHPAADAAPAAPISAARAAGGGLGLGALALPLVLRTWGAVPASVGLAVVAAAGGLAGARARGEDLVPRRVVAWAAEVALAVLVAGGWIWARSGGPRAGPVPGGDLAIAAAAYLATRLAWRAGIGLALHRRRATAALRRLAGPALLTFGLEAAGLAVGAILVRLTMAAPERAIEVTALVVVMGLLCAESTRWARVHRAARSAARALRGELEVARRLDTLTGVESETGLEPALAAAWMEARDAARSIAVVVFDLDHLGRFNDLHGREAGHRGVVRLARTVERGLRPGDRAFRCAGDQVVALLLDATGLEALALADAVRRDLEGQEIDEARALTSSAGVAAFPELTCRDGAELLVLAEGALRRAKALGRNLALLDLGQGRYRSAAGQDIETGEGTAARRRVSPSGPPTFFA